MSTAEVSDHAIYVAAIALAKSAGNAGTDMARAALTAAMPIIRQEIAKEIRAMAPPAPAVLRTELQRRDQHIRNKLFSVAVQVSP